MFSLSTTLNQYMSPLGFLEAPVRTFLTCFLFFAVGRTTEKKHDRHQREQQQTATTTTIERTKIHVCLFVSCRNDAPYTLALPILERTSICPKADLEVKKMAATEIAAVQAGHQPSDATLRRVSWCLVLRRCGYVVGLGAARHCSDRTTRSTIEHPPRDYLPSRFSPE